MVTNGRGKNPLGMLTAGQRNLRITIEHIADQIPVDKIFALKNRHAGKIRKCRMNRIEFVPYPANRRVGKEACHDRIFNGKHRKPPGIKV